MTPDEHSMEKRIRAVYSQLTVNECRLADIILAGPVGAATHTAAELAALAKVSAATTTRFFRKLGFSSYEEARRSTRDSARKGSPLNLLQCMSKTTKLDDLIRAHLENETQQLLNTYMALDRQDLSAIVQKLTQARQIAFLGYRHSQAVASFFHRHMRELRTGVHLLPAPGDTLGEWLGDYGPQDMAVCIGLRRRVPQFSTAMAALQARRVPILYITDVTAGKPAKFAQWVIRCHTDGLLLFDSNTSVVAVVNLINSLVGNALANSGAEHLEKIEEFHELMGELE